MSSQKEYTLRTCMAMKPNERVCFDRRFFDDAFPCGWPSMYETPDQHFLSNMPGSGCGAFRMRRDIANGNIIVSRHEESDKRYYVDPDRAHLFEQMPDGTLERKHPTSDRE